MGNNDDGFIFFVLQMAAIFGFIKLAIERPIFTLVLVSAIAIGWGAFMKDAEQRRQLKQRPQVELIQQAREVSV